MHKNHASIEQYKGERRQRDIPVWWFSGDEGRAGLCFAIVDGVQLILTDETLANLGYTRNDPSGFGDRNGEGSDPRDFLF